MQGSMRKAEERILALVMVFSMILSMTLPHFGLKVQAAGTEEVLIKVQDKNSVAITDAEVKVWKTVEDESTAIVVGYDAASGGYKVTGLDETTEYGVSAFRQGYDKKTGKFTTGTDSSITLDISYAKVEIKAGNGSLKVDGTMTASVTNRIEGKTYVWDSSSSDIVSVDKNGVLTAKKEGTANITAQIEGEPTTKSDSVKVTVSKIDTTVSLEVKKGGQPLGSQDVYVKDTITIGASLKDESDNPVKGDVNVKITGNPEGTETFQGIINDKVNSLNYQFTKEGTYTIEASYAGNDKYNADDTSLAPVTVTVNKKEQAALNVQGNREITYGETIDIPVKGNGTGKIQANPVGSNTGEAEVAVDAENTKVTVTAKKAGTYTLEIKRLTDDEYKEKAETVTFTIKKKELHIKLAAENKEYDGTASAKVSLIQNPVTIADLTDEDKQTADVEDTIKNLVEIGADAAFENINAGTGKKITVSVNWRNLQGDAAEEQKALVNNYSLVAVGENSNDIIADITKRKVVIDTLNVTDQKLVYKGHKSEDNTVNIAGTVKLKEEKNTDDNDSVQEDIKGFTLTGTALREDGATVLREDGTEVNKALTKITGIQINEEHENYELTGWEDYDVSGIKVFVERATIDLTVGDASVEYDDVDGTLGCLGTITVTPDETNVAEGDSIADYKLPDVALVSDFVNQFKAGLDIGTYEEKLCLTGMEGKNSTFDVSENSNYQWKLKTLGTINVVQDTQDYSLDYLTALGNVKIIKNDNKIYVKSGTALKLGINFDFNQEIGGKMRSVYDSVWTEQDGEKINLTATDGLEKLFAEGDSLKVWFADSDGANGSKSFTINVTSDGEAPAVSLTAQEKTLPLQDFASKVTFGLFDKKTVEVQVTAKDDLSGIESLEAAVYTATKEQMEKLAGADQKAIMDLNLSWGSYPAASINDDTKSITWNKAVSVSADAYAVIFVKVSDKVGNTRIYGSNGMVVECIVPNVPTVTFDTSVNYRDGVYTGDVKATIRASEVLDAENVTASGLASVKYTVYKDGNPVIGQTDIELYNDTANVEGDTLANLQNADSMELEKEITIPAEVCNSNYVAVVVTAVDRAGNVVSNLNVADADELKGASIKIDVTRPEVSVSYDNNSVKNEKYFNAGRTATIEITERNLKKDNLIINLKRESDVSAGRYTIDQLNALEGISAKWVMDTQANISEYEYSDGRKNTVQIAFEKDNHYVVSVDFTDQGGLSPENGVSYTGKAVKDFVVDTKAPTASVKYYADGAEIKPGKKETERFYKNKVITAVITITEHNFVTGNEFAKNQIVYAVNGTKVEEGKKTADYQAQANTLKNSAWTQNGDEWTSRVFEYAVDANYTAEFAYTDLAGNSCKLSKDYFTVDRTAPTGTITIGELGTWQKFLSKITFGLFSPKTEKVSLTGDDHTSPVTSVAYTTSYEAMNKSQVEAVTDWKKGTSFNKSPDKQFIVYSKITDEAGNVTYVSSNGVILDSTKPGPSITITASKPSHGVYAGNVPFTIQVEDPTAGKTYSGLKSVSYEILNSGKVTQSGNFDAELKPASKRVKSLKKNLSVNARKNNSNDVVIKVTAVDNAGNTSSKTEKLKIDITKPEISVSYNNNSPLGGKYYKDTRVATVTIRERNFDSNNVRFTITNTDGTRPAISGWTNSSNSGVSDQATHTCTVSFASDGDYTFTLECTDLAGNKAVYGKTDTFTIDKTVPKISVSYDNNAVSNGHYYMAERTATVTITEHNFNAADVKETITASLNGQGITAPSISGFSNNGDTHTATIHYSASGDYTFNISYTDMAGNPAQAYEGDRFTIDLDKPVIKISGVNKANKGAVNPTVEVTDNNYDGTKVTITLEGTKHKSETKDGSRSPINLGERIRLPDLPHTEDADDIYTLTVRAVDQAGNSNEDSYTFSVNRFGSVYTMDKATEEILEKYYTKEEKDLTVTETNTDSLKHQKITCSKDGEIYDLKEGEDYIIEESGTPGSWKVYTYHIKKENFKEDGKYVITIYSEDEAENSSSNQGKNKTIEFVVDKTAPTIVVTGIEDGQRYREDSHDAVIDAKDNIYLKSLRVEIQEEGVGEPSVYEFTEEDLESSYGVVEQAVKSANNWQTVKAVAVDAAGNECTSESIRVLVNSSLLVQFFMNKPLFFGSILILLLILALIAYLIRKKRQVAE